MPNKALKVKLMIRVKNPNGEWRYFLPGNKEGKRSPLTPLCALVGKEPKVCPEGVYYLRYVEDKTPKFVKASDEMKNAGKPPNEKPTPVESLNQALAAVTICQRRLGAKAVGLEITPAVAVTGTGHPLKESATIFLKFVEDNLEHVTFRAYSSAVMPFVEHCKKPTLESVVEDDVLAFGRWLRKGDVEHGRKPLEPRTVFNRVCSLKTFFRYFKIPWPVEDIHMPKYTERVPTAYDPDQVRQLAKFATLDEAEWIAYMVGSGMREKECSYGCWTDFDPEKRGLRVTEKKDFPKFKIKDDEERIIPINDDLVAILTARQKRYPKSRLIFPTAKGEPDGHKLRLLKKLAFRAGLNCGHCQARDEYTGKLKSCREHPVCDKWTLHDFRRTYATMLDIQGTPIDDIRINLGHADIETTRGYIKARNTRDPKIWKAVNKALPGLLAIVKAKS